MRFPLSKEKTKKIGKYLLLAILVLLVGASIGWVKNRSSEKKSLNTSSNEDLTIAQSIPQPLEKFEDFGLTVEKLKISAPIIPDVDGANEQIYYGALKKGVAQFKGSVNPGENGNVFIFGHSSFFKGVSGKYTEIFKELNQLAEGDEFVIHYQKTPYRYKVTKSFETTDTDWSLLDPTPEIKDDKTVTLMTCWPPGTIQKRWGIVASQI